MDARLDPACEGALDLERQHREQMHLLGGGPEGQLATVLRATQEKQLRDHLVACARCRHYDPCCAECGFDARRERHGWLCSQQDSVWRDYLPWNWRAKKAPPKPQGWKTLDRDGTRRIPVAQPATPRGVPPPPPNPRARSPPPAHRPKSHTPTGKPAPSPLAQAYATLGLTSAATADQVRSAFRERAKEYHPDKVAHMAPEFREIAERKMKEINEAYDRIRKAGAPAT